MTGRVEREMSVSHARAHLPELTPRVRDGEKVYLSHYGQRVAALVPIGVAERSERGD